MIVSMVWYGMVGTGTTDSVLLYRLPIDVINQLMFRSGGQSNKLMKRLRGRTRSVAFVPFAY